MIRNKKRQKMIAIIRAIKFKTLIGSVIWSEGINSFSGEKTYFSIRIPPIFIDSVLLGGLPNPLPEGV